MPSPRPDISIHTAPTSYLAQGWVTLPVAGGKYWDTATGRTSKEARARLRERLVSRWREDRDSAKPSRHVERATAPIVDR